MNILNDVMKLKRGLGNKKVTTLVLTPLGRQKSEALNLPEAQWKILDELRDNPCTIRELARQTGVRENKVKIMVQTMINAGYVAKSNEE